MIHILWGSQSGNAAGLAETIGQHLLENGLEVEVASLGERDPEEIYTMENLLIVTSTYGDGEPPDNASEWMSYLKFGEVSPLPELRYAVLGLGDPYYPHFCQCGKDFDEFLGRHGAQALVPRLDCDRYFEDQYQDWLNSLIQVLKISERD
jgi:sulfite reductase (NADPH) flavoprotein alpha-component